MSALSFASFMPLLHRAFELFPGWGAINLAPIMIHIEMNCHVLLSLYVLHLRNLHQTNSSEVAFGFLGVSLSVINLDDVQTRRLRIISEDRAFTA